MLTRVMRGNILLQRSLVLPRRSAGTSIVRGFDALGTMIRDSGIGIPYILYIYTQ